MQGTKVMFSDSELKLVEDKEIILTKTQIIEKVYRVFGEISKGYYETFSPLQQAFPEIFSTLPKISKGENYEGFPWVMLDYPRFFGKETGHFAVRTFFWWGNYFVVQLHLSGNYLKYKSKLELTPIFKELVEHYEVYAGQPNTHWVNYLPQNGMKRLTLNTHSGETGTYYKLMVKLPLNRVEGIMDLSTRMANSLFQMLST